jgi:hypothetical protein
VITLRATLPSIGTSEGASLAIDHEMGALRHLYVPHLTPEPGQVAGDFVFRAPAVILADRERVLAFVIDVDDADALDGARAWLDYDHPKRRLTIGVGAYQVEGHTFFRRASIACRGQTLVLRVHVLSSVRRNDIDDPYRFVASWMWKRWGRPRMAGPSVLGGRISRYLGHVTRWAFEDAGWGREVWQQIRPGDGDRAGAGAPVFIVDVGRHPSIPPADRTWREPRSVWNQAWFSTQRCANGLFRHARQIGSADLERRAREMTNVALLAPERDGLFPSVLRCGAEGWHDAVWINSDRRPRSVSAEACHLVDAAFTARMLLEWFTLTGDRAALDRATRFAARTAELQRASGGFPAWVEPDGSIARELDESAESAVLVSLLFDLASLPGGGRFLDPASRGIRFIERVVADARWEDFETYWSCAPWGAGRMGSRVPRNGVFKQNTLSIAWCAEALLSAHARERRGRHLSLARRCLAELSLYQALHDPPFLTAPAFGGFGVMNADCEWNDARQSLFAPLYLEAHARTADDEMLGRGVAALRASFTMMYCPENARLAAACESRFPMFGAESRGFMMENQGHGGSDEIGTFTIFTWGNGSALAAAATVRDRYPEAFRLAFPEG